MGKTQIKSSTVFIPMCCRVPTKL